LGMQSCCMGHEFFCEVVELGPECEEDLSPGDRVASMPILPCKGEPEKPPVFVGGNPAYGGGYAEYMRLSSKLCVKVPKHVTVNQGALSEPMAVALHGINEAKYGPSETVPVVYGCGPVGLTAIVILKRRGYKPIIAVQRSKFRRDLAKQLGADIVIDPTAGDGHVWEAWTQAMAAKLGVSLEEMRLMERGDYSHGELNLVWNRTHGRWCPPLVIENVGVAGMLEEICKQAPRHTRVVVVGYCMTADAFPHGVFMSKEVELKCVLGYTGQEFKEAVELIGEMALTELGRADLAAIVTKTIPLEEVPSSFVELASNSQNAKVLVIPSQAAAHARL